MAVNNYETWRTDWQKRFCSMDKDALLRKLPFLTIQNERLWVPYFNLHCAVRLHDGVVETTSLSLMDELNIYTMLWYAKEGASRTGDFCSFGQLKDASPFDAAFRSGNLKPFAATFSGHREKLEAALQAFGGRKLATGDVGYEIDVFPCIPMQVVFWDADDEFPAQCNLLFDRSTTDFIHVESVVSIATEALKHLARQAQLPVIGPMFDAK